MKGAPFSTKLDERGTIFYGRYMKGVPFSMKVYERGTIFFGSMKGAPFCMEGI